jgi:hypothetical protein
MPQAYPFFAALGAFLTSDAVAAALVRAILIEVALGALEFTDDGSVWRALDE